MAKASSVRVKVFSPQQVEQNRYIRKWRMSLKKAGGHSLYVNLQAEASAALKCILITTKESKRDLIERLLAREAKRIGPFHFE